MPGQNSTSEGNNSVAEEERPQELQNLNLVAPATSTSIAPTVGTNFRRKNGNTYSGNDQNQQGRGPVLAGAPALAVGTKAATLFATNTHSSPLTSFLIHDQADC
ncbi:unnamed protein product, partial [Amoebophrya sp. A120]